MTLSQAEFLKGLPSNAVKAIGDGILLYTPSKNASPSLLRVPNITSFTRPSMMLRPIDRVTTQVNSGQPQVTSSNVQHAEYSSVRFIKSTT